MAHVALAKRQLYAPPAIDGDFYKIGNVLNDKERALIKRLREFHRGRGDAGHRRVLGSRRISGREVCEPARIELGPSLHAIPTAWLSVLERCRCLDRGHFTFGGFS